jgi:galactose mutarotase-like enzyme
MHGRTIDEIVLEAPGLLCARFVSYGATLVSVLAAGRDGAMEEVTLSQDLENLLHHPRFFGSTVGRYANRSDMEMVACRCESSC